MITLAQRLKTQSQVFREFLHQAMCDLRVAVPGIINSFDTDKQTCTVRIALREKVSTNGVMVDTEISLLLDVPLVLPRAGNMVLTMPVQQGDECLVVFSDMCIDSWYSRGGVQNQLERRRHDLSDGFAILAPWSQPNKISNYSTDAAELRTLDGTVKVAIKNGEIDVTAPTVNVTGSDEVNISGNGHTNIEGKDFLNHKHTGVSTGGGTSGPVQ